VISSGEIEAVVDVPESLVNHLKVNEAIEVIVEPLRMEVMGKVVAIVPDANAAARTFPVKIRLDDKQGQLKPGMSVIARAPTGATADRLTVPRDAIMRTPNGAVVWANIGGQAMSIGVKVLFGVGDRYAIDVLGGGPPLTDGMQVVVEGAERLFPTRPLMIADAGSKK
jgi:RND family efflux transporter MFP subunit